MNYVAGSTNHLGDMTWPEVARAVEQNIPVVVGVGACEQHGPHLPLSTDSLLPVAIAERASQQLPLLVAPPAMYGAYSRALSGGGETFPGTVSLRGTTLLSFLTDVLSGLAKSGFRQIVVQNWHLENAGYLWEACTLASERYPQARFLLLENPFPEFTPAQMETIFPDGFTGWAAEHASVVETSMMLATWPHLVRWDLVVDDAAERQPTWDVIPAPAEFIPKSGVLARASRASAEIGELLMEATVGRLVDAIRTEFDVEL